MSKTSKTAYYYPSKSAKSTGESPSEKVNTAINNSEKKRQLSFLFLNQLIIENIPPNRKRNKTEALRISNSR